MLDKLHQKIAKTQENLGEFHSQEQTTENNYFLLQINVLFQDFQLLCLVKYVIFPKLFVQKHYLKISRFTIIAVEAKVRTLLNAEIHSGITSDFLLTCSAILRLL